MIKNKKPAIVVGVLVIFLLLALFFIAYLNWQQNYKHLLPKNTTLGNLNLGGYDKEEALKLLEVEEDKIRATGINFQYNNKTVNFPLKISSGSVDIPDSKTIYADAVIYNREEIIERLFNKNHSFLKYLAQHLPFVNFSDNYKAGIFSSPTTISQWLKENFPELTIEPESAFFSLKDDSELSVLINNPEKIGKEIDEESLLKEFEDNLNAYNNQTITIKTRSKYPTVRQSNLELVKNKVQTIIDNGDLIVSYTDAKKGLLSWKIKIKDIVTWISVKKNNNTPQIDFNQEKIKEYLSKNIAQEINQSSILPRMEIKNGKVSNWQQGKNGREVNLEANAALLTNALLNSERETSLIVKDVDVDSLVSENNFKITEIIGTGHSSFSGSPANRRHNIAIGAASVQGLLIAPGEEFSLIKTLGDIDASTGYLPELVIKDNKTVPEYGGGLCQVATTVFRSALASGLPISARRNHSYRVSYYEPAGTDATIYDPWPDFKFINDTSNYILIQSRIEGDDLYFDFWGTSDGRIVTSTAPTIYNIVKPAPTKIIETDTLAPGEKKCTERAHNGADAYFDYTVIYPEGATTTLEQTVRFSSHYVPWQEVCLVGKAVATQASTTPETTPPNTGTETSTSTTQ